MSLSNMTKIFRITIIYLLLVITPFTTNNHIIILEISNHITMYKSNMCYSVLAFSSFLPDRTQQEMTHTSIRTLHETATAMAP